MIRGTSIAVSLILVAMGVPCFASVELVNVTRANTDGTYADVAVVLFGPDGGAYPIPLTPGARFTLPDGYNWEIAKPEVWEDEKWTSQEVVGGPLNGGTVIIDRTQGRFDRLYVAYVPVLETSNFNLSQLSWGLAIGLAFWALCAVPAWLASIMKQLGWDAT